MDYIKRHWFILLIIIIVWGVVINIVNNKTIKVKKPQVDSSKTDSLISVFDSVNESKEKYKLQKIHELQKQNEIIEEQKEIEKKEKERIKLEKEKERLEKEKEKQEKENEKKMKQEIELKLKRECEKNKKLEEYFRKNIGVGNPYGSLDTTTFKD